ncbi:MAG: 3-hydroxyacyl-ACP dehydratase FabZ [Clostridiales bacterium]|nr:3-hydroxyacyl-ACP dehydratase FabZ [Clostridiales bacterium]
MELSVDEIKKILPHRYPFLFVDRIIDFEPGKWAKGIKLVSANEMLFLGHFPDMNIMPGVLILEALAQTGAVAALTAPEDKGKIALFGGIKNARFRKQVVPGDVLQLECVLTKRKGSIGFAEAEAKVEEDTVCLANFAFAIRDIDASL